MAGIDGMAMGRYAKVYLQFVSNFWDKKWGKAREILLTGGKPVGWMTWALNLDHPKYAPGSKILSYHFVDDFAKQVESQPVEVTKAHIMKSLRQQFGSTIEEPLKILVTNWTHNPLTFGSYSNWPIGYTTPEWEEMVKNEGHLYFAGEHVDELFGYVHGALNSGQSVASSIAEELSRGPKLLRKFSNDPPAFGQHSSVDRQQWRQHHVRRLLFLIVGLSLVGKRRSLVGWGAGTGSQPTNARQYCLLKSEATDAVVVPSAVVPSADSSARLKAMI
eukprot:CAMPEP_0180678054 /NCGR_PEP_ID=MMETSP1037_2-20121125/68179_1 /TAXON_ID=632150 /ORGANISM="Azadinium spinosum, Strain 3D9" /LENGTH=274 /DNA_ID=CAMNT_0022707675 /DNA_START=111 /DNA_END=933 /DNA_ORIENTATION=+